MRDAVLDILRTDGGRYSFPIKQLVITDYQRTRRWGTRWTMKTPVASGASDGVRKLWSAGGRQAGSDAGEREDLRMSDVKLDGISELHGVLTSKGSFRGTLAGIEGQAESSVANFSVGKGRGVTVSGTATGAVNALNGEVELQGRGCEDRADGGAPGWGDGGRAEGDGSGCGGCEWEGAGFVAAVCAGEATGGGAGAAAGACASCGGGACEEFSGAVDDVGEVRDSEGAAYGCGDGEEPDGVQRTGAGRSDGTRRRRWRMSRMCFRAWLGR